MMGIKMKSRRRNKFITWILAFMLVFTGMSANFSIARAETTFSNATNIYNHNTWGFDHLDVKLAGSITYTDRTTDENGNTTSSTVTKSVTVSNPSAVVYTSSGSTRLTVGTPGSTSVHKFTYTGSTVEFRCTGLRGDSMIQKTDKVVITCDITIGSGSSASTIRECGLLI
jgi:hypothetical protein